MRRGEGDRVTDTKASDTGQEEDAVTLERRGARSTMDRAIELAQAIATRSAPLGVRTTLESAYRARLEGEQAAFARLEPDMVALFESDDGREGLASFVERRDANFTGQ